MTDRRWSIWIDTGGTFTDCLALPPDGELAGLRRAKVLSTGALRGRVVEVLDSKRLLIAVNWEACDDFVRGFGLRVLGRPGNIGVVGRFDSSAGLIELEAAMSSETLESMKEEPGRRFEVRGDEPAPIVAARLVTGTPAGDALPPLNMRLGTTRGTNALLERRGARVALFITEGFADLLRIGDQQRPDLFALNVVKAEPLYEAVVEVRGQLDAAGREIAPLDLPRVEAEARRLVQDGFTVAAVTLMHSYRNPDHELRIVECLKRVGFTHVVDSAALSPLIRILHRAETAVVDAYLAPIIEGYLDDVSRRIASGSGRLHIMTSAGGLTSAASYRARDSLLSGPAGGVAGMAAAGRMSGFDRLIGFDMGGTSTDVARYDGDYEYRFEQRIAGARLVAPALAIETVAAGGGSICEFVDDRLKVGPESASADPGPACYGAGGPLTLTDVNLLGGRLDADRFEIPIDVEAATHALDDIAMQVAAATGRRPDTNELLDGFLEIANERMADAIAQISLRRGFDPADYALVAFGGAGGQHACAIADRLGMATVIMPADASLLSALGIGHAAIERFQERQVLRLLDEIEPELEGVVAAMDERAIEAVAAEGVERREIRVRRRIVSLRLLGQDTALPIDLTAMAALRASFAERYQAMYGTPPGEAGKPVEVESVRVVASSQVRAVRTAVVHGAGMRECQTARSVTARIGGMWRQAPVFMREDLSSGDNFRGPALVFSRRSAFVIDDGWEARIDEAGAIVARRHDGVERRHAQAGRLCHQNRTPDVVQRELFTNRFSAIAEEMGRMLERTALSTNVKERLDFSCTLLNAAGELLVNAPHMPVHLGAMGLCVRSVRQVIDVRPGDVIVTNHPRNGGSHLPDMTVITPVFDAARALLGYTASRAHHAEIGGTRPGSMPPDATTLAEEGVIIEPRYLIETGRSCFAAIEAMLRAGPHPSRAVADNLADLRAQVAANHHGAASLRRLADQSGPAVIHEQMAALRDRAEALARAALQDVTDGTYDATERLDDGAELKVAITIRGDEAVFDFTGTSAVHPGNLNATPAIVTSAVIYVLRLLIGERLPLNEGIMRAVELVIPRGCILNPEFPADPRACPAVVGGNVETSQRLVGTLLKALGLCASAQGTMNNVLFGNDRLGYYETVCGGTGAGPGFDGADAVQSHMTNTRITDPEILEHRYPVRLNRFAIRRGSGGAGRFRGGDGAVREIEFLAPMSLSIVSQHRVAGPFGLEGGQPGEPGRQRVVRAGGEVIELGPIDGCEIGAGDRFMLETPGGGGYGEPINGPGAGTRSGT